MTALIALASALIIGGADYAGGAATRRDNELPVTTLVQFASGVTAIGLALIVSSTSVTTADAVAGGIAGVSGVFSFAAFYRALSMGAMGVVAPLTAVIGAVIPATVSIARGEVLTATTAMGLSLAVVAVALVARRPSQPREERAQRTISIQTIGFAVVAGIGFSVFYLALAQTSSEAGLWPLVIARVVSVPVVAGASLLLNRRVLPVPSVRRIAVLGGVAEMVANVLILVALQRGPVAVASVFGAFYPVSTAVLAFLLLGERLARVQIIGAVLAVAALPLVAF